MLLGQGDTWDQVSLDWGVLEGMVSVVIWCLGRAVAAPQDWVLMGAEGATGFILTLFSSCLNFFPQACLEQHNFGV